MKSIVGVIEAIAAPRKSAVGVNWRSGVKIAGEWVNKTGSQEAALEFVKPLVKGMRVRIECNVVKDEKGREANEAVKIEVVKPTAEESGKAREGMVADFKFFLTEARKMGLGEDKVTAECAMHLNNQYQKKK